MGDHYFLSAVFSAGGTNKKKLDNSQQALTHSLGFRLDNLAAAGAK